MDNESNSNNGVQGQGTPNLQSYPIIQTPQIQGSPQAFYQQQPTQGQYPYTCPRCYRISNQRFCNYCGFDLYSYQQQGWQSQPPYQYSNQTQQQNFTQPNYYMQQPQDYGIGITQKKSKTALIISLSIVLFVVLMIATIAITSVLYRKVGIEPNDYFKKDIITDQSGDIQPNGVSKKEYHKLRVGMSYAHISSIIGGDGVISDQGQTPLGEQYITLTWIVETNPEAFVYITFINDAASDIIEDGLLD